LKVAATLPRKTAANPTSIAKTLTAKPYTPHLAHGLTVRGTAEAEAEAAVAEAADMGDAADVDVVPVAAVAVAIVVLAAAAVAAETAAATREVRNYSGPGSAER
jgi:hypothetical protein